MSSNATLLRRGTSSLSLDLSDTEGGKRKQTRLKAEDAPTYWMKTLDLEKIVGDWNPRRQIRHAIECRDKMKADDPSLEVLSQKIAQAQSAWTLVSACDSLIMKQYLAHAEALAHVDLDWPAASIERFLRKFFLRHTQEQSFADALRLVCADASGDQWDLASPCLSSAKIAGHEKHFYRSDARVQELACGCVAQCVQDRRRRL